MRRGSSYVPERRDRQSNPIHTPGPLTALSIPGGLDRGRPAADVNSRHRLLCQIYSLHSRRGCSKTVHDSGMRSYSRAVHNSYTGLPTADPFPIKLLRRVRYFGESAESPRKVRSSAYRYLYKMQHRGTRVNVLRTTLRI
jgi:hypothetical protein